MQFSFNLLNGLSMPFDLKYFNLCYRDDCLNLYLSSKNYRTMISKNVIYIFLYCPAQSTNRGGIFGCSNIK